jgi:hypothetical protein
MDLHELHSITVVIASLGVSLSKDDTPEVLGLDDQDTIDAIIEQCDC